MQYILAHDLGTSGDKATLFTTDGQLVGSVVAAYPCQYTAGNRAEQNPEDWYGAVCRTTRGLMERISPADVVGVSFSGHMMGMVLLDGQGQLLRPAIIWADQRATREQEILTQRVGDQRFYEITGNRNNPTNSVCKIMWSAANDNLTSSVGKVLNCKDYLVYRLTGSLGTDYSDASGTGIFDLNTFTWSEEILEAAGIGADVMPQLYASTDLAGGITRQAALDTGLLEGTPVFCGCGDGTAASVGSGISQVGQGYLSLGTSAWISYLDTQPLLDSQQRNFNLAGISKNSVFPVGSMQAAGSSYSWMRDQLCRAEGMDAGALGTDIYAQINSKISQVPAGANGVLFMPYLIGERTPWWDASIQGSFLGLRQDTTHADMLRAVMEGVCINLRLILEAFQEKRTFDTLRLIGGAAKAPVWQQMVADVLNVRVEKMNLLEEGCSLGAAMVAGIGAGVFAGTSDIDRFLHVDGVCQPDPESVELYEKIARRMEDAYHRLKGFF